jgi:hypothetical protein
MKIPVWLLTSDDDRRSDAEDKKLAAPPRGTVATRRRA